MAFCNGERSEDPAAVSKVKYYVKHVQSTYKSAHTACNGSTLKDVEHFGKNQSQTLSDVPMSPGQGVLWEFLGGDVLLAP